MKHKVDMDGNEQLDFFSASVIDVMYTPSLEKLIVRKNEVLRLIECGDADYARMIGEGSKWRYIASIKNYKWIMIDGERWDVFAAKGIVKFLDSWQSRRRYFLDEVASLDKTINFISQKGE